MDGVEDELTPYPNEPDRWMQIDRLFPPQMDRMSSVKGCDVKRFDSRRHVTYVSDNGAIELRSLRLRRWRSQGSLHEAGQRWTERM